MASRMQSRVEGAGPRACRSRSGQHALEEPENLSCRSVTGRAPLPVERQAVLLSRSPDASYRLCGVGWTITRDNASCGFLRSEIFLSLRVYGPFRGLVR